MNLLKDLNSKILVDLLYLITFSIAAFQKVSGLKVPSWFLKQFENSILNLFDGSLHIQFIIISLLELYIAVLALVSLLKNKTKNSLQANYLKLASICFIILALGQRLTFKFDQAAYLFFYAVISIFLLKSLEGKSERQ